MKLTIPRDKVVVIIRPVDDRCNMACIYCNAAPYSPARYTMSYDTLARVIEQASIPPHRFVQFVWHGGEPLLAGVAFYKAAIALQKKFFGGDYYRQRCENVIQTNGISLLNGYLDLFQANGFCIGISLDGPDLASNKYRLPITGGEAILRKTIEACREVRRRGMPLLIIGVVHDANLHRARDLYRFYCDLDVTKISFNPRFLSATPELNTKPSTYFRFLREIRQLRDTAQRQGERALRIGIIDDVMAVADGAAPRMCFFSNSCHRFISVNSQGEIFTSCTDGLGIRLGDLDSPGLDGCIVEHTRSPHFRMLAALGGGTAAAAIGPGCPKYSLGDGDLYMPGYRSLLGEISREK